MARTNEPLRLLDYAMQLPDAADRERVLVALDQARTVPPDDATLAAVDARWTRDDGSVDLQGWMIDELRRRHERAGAETTMRGEVEALLHAAWLLRVRLAYLPIGGDDGNGFVRIAKMQ